jgi:CheY-like chemotaxis protein
VPRNVRGDAVRIKQILLNLVNNAIKFTERGVVSLTVAPASDSAMQFNVSDSGPGIAETTRARLFQRFEQADGAQRHGGSGLGLAICRELVARMDGTIVLNSTPGVGSTFGVTLQLPQIDAAKNETASASPLPRGGENTTEPYRVLLVEDDATVAEVISGLLRAYGYGVGHVAHGLAALAELDAAHYDLALIDLDLPGVDGLALARMLRAREAQSEKVRIPLVGISARSVGDEESLCVAAGMDAFLRKPVSGVTLAAVIEKMRV